MHMNKLILGSILFTVLIGGIIVWLVQRPGVPSPAVPSSATNVAMVDGKQVIQVRAKGGYAPRTTLATANVPTTLQMQTNGTFDCSSALAIPSLGIRTSLPASGTTPIDIPPQKPGTTLQGICAMGMYRFSVTFR